MNEPTEAQVKKNIIIANKELNKWCGTEDINYHDGIEALGFLFKYAVPRVREILGELALVKLLIDWIRDFAITIGDKRKDPALALFWVIWKIINE